MLIFFNLGKYFFPGNEKMFIMYYNIIALRFFVVAKIWCVTMIWHYDIQEWQEHKVIQ